VRAADRDPMAHDRVLPKTRPCAALAATTSSATRNIYNDLAFSENVSS
jgi:hypothetical protein